MDDTELVAVLDWVDDVSEYSANRAAQAGLDTLIVKVIDLYDEASIYDAYG